LQVRDDQLVGVLDVNTEPQLLHNSAENADTHTHRREVWVCIYLQQKSLVFDDCRLQFEVFFSHVVHACHRSEKERERECD
jgi:hypothetical protein